MYKEANPSNMRRDYKSLIIKLNYVEGPSETSDEADSNVVRLSSFLFPPTRP